MGRNLNLADPSRLSTYIFQINIFLSIYGKHNNNPKAQAKIIACLRGRGLDYAVDLRHESPTYRQWISVELTPENRKQLYVPKGCGHAFLTPEDNTQIRYRIDEYSDPLLQRAVSYADPELNIDFHVKRPVLSSRDADAPFLKDCDCNF